MRKAQKQEVLEMIQTLHQAHDEVKNYVDKKNYTLAQDILSQCQECAISIGTAIEKFEGEGFVTVSYVEAYCDTVFSAYEELNGNDANANKIHKNLKKQLLRIENSVKNDVPVRKEIAFFPYKASMWDALESVYLAAKADPDCDAYCVPIPYYDRNLDKSLGQMHYEGREYPKNIEVIDWQTYNFEERKPDVVYIHNPYDDWNLVTCVHPRYFSANLKKYTEELVYIPYFVLDEIEPDDQTRIDGMKHFCFLPGVINADKVIVQSEKMKQIYVNEYLKAATANRLQGKHVDRKQLEEKFLGLGSPKFDKVKNTKKEDLEIPAEWLRIIEKPDGSWKKIIFYNTSIAALLEHNEKMLEKMNWVFNIFKENKDEVALLWRPHPLIETTVSAMRPQLWMEYEKIVNQYRQEGWGIYDDTADMDRAVVLSDAYYGDMSSIVSLVVKLGKTVIIQKANQQNLISVFSFTPKGKYLYFNGKFDKFLYRLNRDNGKIELIDIMNVNVLYNCFAFGEIITYQDNVVLLPFCANKITIYNEKEKTLEYISHRLLENAGIRKAVRYEDYIYLLNISLEKSLVLDLKTKQISALSDISNDDINGCETYFHRDVCVVQESIFLPGKMQDTVVEYNMRSNTIFVHKLKNMGVSYATIAYDGEKFWLTGNDRSITKWNRDTQDCQIIYDLPQSLKTDSDSFEEYFSCSIQIGKYIYFFPLATNMIIRINTESEVVQEVLRIEEQLVCWCAGKISERDLFFELSDVNDNMARYSMVIDTISGEITSNYLEAKRLECDRKLCIYKDTEKVIYENMAVLSDTFLAQLLIDKER